jgi:putative nucleotidyltransferase with HDIG domain
MSNPTSIKDIIHNNLTIPTIPAVVQKVTALIEDPNCGTAEIGQLIAQDAPLAAKVLRIANSAYYGLSGECMSTQHASTVLGVRVLRNIVTQVAVISQFDHLEKETGFDVSGLWKHSVLTAHLCSFFAKRCRKALGLTAEELYVCGLLHDIGKIVMLDGLGQDYVELAVAAKNSELALFAAEKRHYTFTHTDVGGVVASRWGLPQAIGQAIQFHHGPSEKVASSTVVSLVANANLFVHRLDEGNPAAATQVFDGQTAGFLGLARRDLEEAVDFLGNQSGTQI